MIIPITIDRNCLMPRSLRLKRLKLAASWRKQAVVALRSGDRRTARRLMSYCSAETDSAARYRMDNPQKMELPR